MYHRHAVVRMHHRYGTSVSYASSGKTFFEISCAGGTSYVHGCSHLSPQQVKRYEMRDEQRCVASFGKHKSGGKRPTRDLGQSITKRGAPITNKPRGFIFLRPMHIYPFTRHARGPPIASGALHHLIAACHCSVLAQATRTVH